MLVITLLLFLTCILFGLKISSLLDFFFFLVENFILKGLNIYKKGKTFLKKTSPGYIQDIYP